MQVLAIVFQFPVNHGLRAVEVSVSGIGGRDANIDSRQAVAESLRQDIRWTQICSWDELSHLGLSTGGTLLNP